MIRILIAEDQTLVLGALSALLRLEPDFNVVGALSAPSTSVWCRTSC
jgi:DNA-binding NarL/FixJ family response regulator